jgi:hypothetical protein
VRCFQHDPAWRCEIGFSRGHVSFASVRCFLPQRRRFHFYLEPVHTLIRLNLDPNHPRAFLPALVSAMLLAACRIIGGTLTRYEPYLLDRTRELLSLSLAYADRLDDFLWASTVLAMYYAHMARFLEAQ